MLLQHSTWCDIDTYLKRSKAILIPIGSVEQHGPTGLLGTDILCPQIISDRAMEMTDILIAPPFIVGCAQHHLDFAGTISLRPSTMIAAMVDWTRSLVRHGFERFYWFNGHGGNIATVQAAFAEIYAERSFSPDHLQPAAELSMELRNWWEFPAVKDLSKELFPVGDGLHATASEISVTQAAYPDSVRETKLEPKIAPVGKIRDAQHYRRNFPDGRIGSDPTLASVAYGRLLIEAAAKALADDFEKFNSNRAS